MLNSQFLENFDRYYVIVWWQKISLPRLIVNDKWGKVTLPAPGPFGFLWILFTHSLEETSQQNQRCAQEKFLHEYSVAWFVSFHGYVRNLIRTTVGRSYMSRNKKIRPPLHPQCSFRRDLGKILWFSFSMYKTGAFTHLVSDQYFLL